MAAAGQVKTLSVLERVCFLNFYFKMRPQNHGHGSYRLNGTIRNYDRIEKSRRKRVLDISLSHVLQDSLKWDIINICN